MYNIVWCDVWADFFHYIWVNWLALLALWMFSSCRHTSKKICWAIGSEWWTKYVFDSLFHVFLVYTSFLLLQMTIKRKKQQIWVSLLIKRMSPEVHLLLIQIYHFKSILNYLFIYLFFCRWREAGRRARWNSNQRCWCRGILPLSYRNSNYKVTMVLYFLHFKGAQFQPLQNH